MRGRDHLDFRRRADAVDVDHLCAVGHTVRFDRYQQACEIEFTGRPDSFGRVIPKRPRRGLKYFLRFFGDGRIGNG